MASILLGVWRSFCTASEHSVSEFWNQDEEVNSDEDISESEDEALVMKGSLRPNVSSKASLDEKFKALERAEESYYQNKGQNKQAKSGPTDRNIISEALREASKKRLLNALNQAKERFGNHPFDIISSSTSLELDCFKKYEKVGKTFYNSQVAATVRWLSSASYEQMSERLTRNSTANAGRKLPEVFKTTPTASVSSPSNQAQVPNEREGQVKDKSIENVVHEPAMVDESTRGRMMDLPRIPSFSEFVTRKAKKQAGSPSSGFGSSMKRKVEAEKNQRVYAEKKRKNE